MNGYDFTAGYCFGKGIRKWETIGRICDLVSLDYQEQTVEIPENSSLFFADLVATIERRVREITGV